MSRVLSPDELEAALRDIGAKRYHDRHPFHQRLHSGACSRAEVQAWALNRYYYQSRIPQKDATVLARMEDATLRRAWRTRIIDHDGMAEGEGGIAKWLVLTGSLGFDCDYVISKRGILPGTRFAVDAYLTLVRERSLLEAIASSLTEMFSPKIIAERVQGMLAAYDFVGPDTLVYFNARPEQAGRDVEVALSYVREHACTVETQKVTLAALRTKCDILWAMLDALEHAYVTPGRIPPGAWDPAG